MIYIEETDRIENIDLHYLNRRTLVPFKTCDDEFIGRLKKDDLVVITDLEFPIGKLLMIQRITGNSVMILGEQKPDGDFKIKVLLMSLMTDPVLVSKKPAIQL